jgi:hypothetical protein
MDRQKKALTRADLFVGFSVCARKIFEGQDNYADIVSKAALKADPVKAVDRIFRTVLTRSYLKRVTELHESAALSLKSRRYATAFALVRPIYESSLYGMYLAALAPTDILVPSLLSGVRTSPRMKANPKNIIRQLAKKRKEFHNFVKAHEQWWEIVCNNTHGTPPSLPLSMIGNNPIDPGLEDIFITHAATPVMVFLGIAQELGFIDSRNVMLGRSAAIAQKLLACDLQAGTR